MRNCGFGGSLMRSPAIAPDLIAALCQQATAAIGSDTVLQVDHDALDGSVWVRMSSWPRAQEALKALTAHGIGATDAGECIVHAIGWDRRLLRWRLGATLAGVDDLTSEWDATAELTRYHYDRRFTSVVEPDPSDVLHDVEAAMRSCSPLPHRAPRVDDIAGLLDLIADAEHAYQRLIAEHITYAEQVLTEHMHRQHHGAA